MTKSMIFDTINYENSPFSRNEMLPSAMGNSQASAIKRALWGALAIAATMGANPAVAAVQVTNVQLAGPGGYYTVNINGENVYDAGVVLTIGNSQVFADCDDIYHNIYLGQTATFNVAPFTAASMPSNFHGGTYTAAQIGAMSWLVGTSAAI